MDYRVNLIASFYRKPAGMPISIWREQWGVFDWRNIKYDDYPHSNDDWDNDRWRWEYLRRDPFYRMDFFKASYEEGEIVSADKYFEYAVKKIYDPRLSYEKLPKNFRFERYPLLMRVSHKQYDVSIADVEIDEDFMSIIEQDEKHTVDVRFDLRRGITEQCDAANVLLKNLQAIKKRKPRLRNLPQGLRALDAYQAGENITFIAQKFFHSDEKECGRILLKAKQLWKIL